jgi:hypothetical protein
MLQVGILISPRKEVVALTKLLRGLPDQRSMGLAGEIEAAQRAPSG